MRPIYLGLILFTIGLIGLVSVSVYANIISWTIALICIFGAIMGVSIPVAVVFEFIKWQRERKKESKEKK
jgi:pilus assembly protein TadC